MHDGGRTEVKQFRRESGLLRSDDDPGRVVTLLSDRSEETICKVGGCGGLVQEPTGGWL